MNRIYFALYLGLLTLLLCPSCKKETSEPIPPLRIGKENNIERIELSKDSFRNIVLSGGNKKYSVQVEDSRIATATIAQDTLRIRAIWEGETYATIRSHDQELRLNIHVAPAELYLSQEKIRLYPREDSKQIRLMGGGDIVKLEAEDPEQVLRYKWHASSGILELRMDFEGEAKLTAISQNGKRKTLLVEAKLDGETKEVGFYNTATSSRSYIKPSPVMVVHRRGVGVWLMTGARPNDGLTTTTTKLSPILNPKVGEDRELQVSIRQASVPSKSIPSGSYKVRVEEVREKHVVLRGRGFKFVLPYDTN